MTPPAPSARQLLSQYRTAQRDADTALADIQHRLNLLRSQIGQSSGIENELRDLDSHESELFAAAARSDDPEAALSKVRVDHLKRSNLLKKKALADGKRAALETAIADLQHSEAKVATARRDAADALKVAEANVLLEELVPTAIALAAEAIVTAGAARIVLNGVFDAVVGTAHHQPEGQQRAALFAAVEKLGADIKASDAIDHSERSKVEAGQIVGLQRRATDPSGRGWSLTPALRCRNPV
jgi:hypothetical protein